MARNSEKDHLPVAALVADAIKRDPRELVERFPRNGGDSLAEQIAWRCARICEEPHYQFARLAVRDYAGNILAAGIADHHAILEPSLPMRDGIETARRYLEHEKTLHAIASLAIIGDSRQLRTLIYANFDGRKFGADATGQHLELYINQSEKARKYCPFAGDESHVSPRPLFRRFHSWSNELLLAELLRDGRLR